MSITIIRPKDHDAWLEVRAGGIGSSEIATVVGLNPWETPYQLWRRKVGLDPAKEETFAMKAGHYLEDAVAMFWQDETGNQVIKSSAGDWIVRDNERPFLQVSPDRTYWLKGAAHNKENKGILECKTTQMQIEEENIPLHWFAQLQYQCGVSGIQHGALAWLCSGRSFGHKELEFVPDFFDMLASAAEKFWRDYVLTKQEPPVTDVRDVLSKYAKSKPKKAVEASEDVFAAYRALKDVMAKIKALDEEKTALENNIKMRLQDAEELFYAGQTIATWKSAKPSMRFNADAFKAEHPDLYEQYCKETAGARTFLVKDFYKEDEQ